MSGIRAALAAMLLALVLSLLAGRPLLARAGAFLVYQDRIAPADAIVVLGGGRRERIAEGIRLFAQRYADTLIFTGKYRRDAPHDERANWALEARRFALEHGVPEERILVILSPRSTFDDAALSRDVCLRHHFKSLIVVSEPYHTRRIFHLFNRVYRGTGIKVMVYPVQDSWYRGDTWWRSADGIRKTGKEYVKLAYYLVRGYLA